tara:strand:+ start:16346 stop:17278 length:933 start_codon:yes stop_codon:yes gene_type:complete
LIFAGFDKIIEPFKKFSLVYLVLFVLATTLLHIINSLRWAAVLKYQGVKVPFLLLLRYKLIGTAVNYLTPAARLGGEPVRGYLLKKKLSLKSKQAYSSILIEMSLGMSIDTLFISVILIAMLLFFTLPNQIVGFALTLSLLATLLLIIFYSTLIKRLGPFSFIFRFFSSFIRTRFLRKLAGKIVSIEDSMIEFLHFRRKGVIQAIFISMLSWPVTFLQYKFALLSIGFDASITIILLSIIATSFAAIIPIPAAFGVQEAGHFSVFSLVAAANVGIALSILIRFKDLISTLIGLILLSHEGLSIIEMLKKK